ncbi:hypothetical protein B296_00007930 [Ensete ventricosum]|uniref:Uncharacterized protein n=1 Tax=Ensete ventricosum TaxID=4639 RepID=A0A427AQ53_ENSVE|nr:hypothetical protein B296_00007930 [Ensete ventricosum]
MNDRVGLTLENEDFCRSGVDSPSMAIRVRNSFGSYPGLETNWGDVGNQELKALKIGRDDARAMLVGHFVETLVTIRLVGCPSSLLASS